MKYSPLPGDTITKGDLTLHVERVFPAQVVFHFTQRGGAPFNETIITPEEFDTKARGSVANGASIWRGGVQLLPEISILEPEPHTLTTEEAAAIGIKGLGAKIYPLTEVTQHQITTPMTTEPSTHPLTDALVERLDAITELRNAAPLGITGSSHSHARLSPSDSKRWTHCSSSIAYQEANAHRVAKDNSTEASKIGTEAHEWAAKLLMGKIAPIDIPDEFRSYVVDYANHCTSLVPGAELTHLDTCIDDAQNGFDPAERAFFVEEEIPLFYQEEQKGTADFMALQSVNGEVTHFYGRDYKHGAGVLVTTAENTQLAIYTYSAITRLEGAFTFTDDTIVDMSVIQPRHREADTQTPWIITLGDLRVFCREIEYQAITAREAANRVRERIGAPGRDVSVDEIKEAAPGAQFRPSEGDSGACRWCKCKAFCTARFAAMSEDMEIPGMSVEQMISNMPMLSKDEEKLPVAERLALRSEVLGARGAILMDDYLVNVVAKTPAWQSFLKDAAEYLESRLLDGEEIDGVKLVDGREGNRDWTNSAEAEIFLKNQGLKQDERFNFVLRSPAQVEKLIATKLKSSVRTKNRFEALITRSPAKKKLAISADSRQAVPSAVAMMPTVDDEFEV